MFLHLRRILTFRNMIPTAHRAQRVRAPMKQLIHSAGPLGDTWEANHTTLYNLTSVFPGRSWELDDVKMLFPICMRAGGSSNCWVLHGELPSMNWSTGTGSLLQAPTQRRVQPGEVQVTQPSMLQLPAKECLPFQRPQQRLAMLNSSWEQVQPDISGGSFILYHETTTKILLLVWVIQEAPNYNQILISPSSCRLHGTKQKYSTIFSFCTDLKITMSCWKT